MRSTVLPAGHRIGAPTGRSCRPHLKSRCWTVHTSQWSSALWSKGSREQGQWTTVDVQCQIVLRHDRPHAVIIESIVVLRIVPGLELHIKLAYLIKARYWSREEMTVVTGFTQAVLKPVRVVVVKPRLLHYLCDNVVSQPGQRDIHVIVINKGALAVILDNDALCLRPVSTGSKDVEVNTVT